MQVHKAFKAATAATTLTLLLAGLGSMPTSAGAGTDVDLRLGFYSDAEAFAVGGGLLASVGSNGRWFFNPNLEFAMPDGGNIMAVSADFHYDFPTGSSLSPYLGGGPALMIFSPDGGDSSTDLGLNLLGGVSSLSGAVRPFAQIKAVFSDDTEVALMGGVRF